MNYYVYMYRCIVPVYNIDLNTAIYIQQSISFFTRVSTKPTNPAMYMEKDHLRLLRNFLDFVSDIRGGSRILC